MPGGLLQIAAYGAQDVYLTDKPQITYFKVVYRRHSNFSIEPFEFTFQDGPNFGTKNKLTIYRNGDLMSKMYIKIVLYDVQIPPNGKFAWIRRIGHAILKYVEIEIGGQIIDKQTGTWLDIWYELARSGKHDKGYMKMIGDVEKLTNYDNKNKPKYDLFIPLKFWFNRNYGLALPIIAIQYHDIIIRVEFEKIKNLIIKNNEFIEKDISKLKILNASIITDFIFLDIEERNNFAKNSHEYLIELVQSREDSVMSNMKRIRLDFNYPTKELIWGMRNGNYTSSKNFLCYTNRNIWDETIKKCSIDILKNSVLLLDAPDIETDDFGNEIILDNGIEPYYINGSSWEEFMPNTSEYTLNGKILINNNSTTNSLWINTSSLKIGNYNLLDKINGTVNVDVNNNISFINISNEITIKDISIPLDKYQDTRIDKKTDVSINMFSNYGLYLDGSINPIEYSLLRFNDQDRFTKRHGNFFNYLQPEMHHSNTPLDGINVYSFSINPESHQPSGTANFSLINNITFSTWIKKINEKNNEDYNLLQNLNITNENTLLHTFAYSYNIIRINNGMFGVIYDK